MDSAGSHRHGLHLHRRVPLVEKLRVEADELRVGGGGVGRGSREQRPLEAREPSAARQRGPPPQLPGRAADKHVVGRRVQHPVVALAGVVVVSRHLHEALVEAQVVSDRVLPALSVFPVVREVGHDVFIYAVQCESFLGTVPYRHHDESVVAVRWLLVFLFAVVVVLGLGAVDGFGSGDVELGIAEVRLGGRGLSGRRRERGLGGCMIHQYRVYTEISFELHHFVSL